MKRTLPPSAEIEDQIDQLLAVGAGESWSYSNTGWILLGLIVEAASGNTLATELDERIFTPLRLRATSFDAKPRITGPHAHGYSRVGAR